MMSISRIYTVAITSISRILTVAIMSGWVVHETTWVVQRVRYYVSGAREYVSSAENALLREWCMRVVREGSAREYVAVHE